MGYFRHAQQKTENLNQESRQDAKEQENLIFEEIKII